MTLLSLVCAMLNVWVWLDYFMSHLGTLIASHTESFALANALVLNGAPVHSRLPCDIWGSFHFIKDAMRVAFFLSKMTVMSYIFSPL